MLPRLSSCEQAGGLRAFVLCKTQHKASQSVVVAYNPKAGPPAPVIGQPTHSGLHWLCSLPGALINTLTGRPSPNSEQTTSPKTDIRDSLFSPAGLRVMTPARRHPALPHFAAGEWAWLRGALSTVDRSYGFLDHFFHHIADTHVRRPPTLI